MNKQQKISIHYVLRADGPDGEELEETEEPLEFTLGNDEILPALEAQLEGLSEGDKKEFTIPCDQAFGAYDDQLMRALPKALFFTEEDPQADGLEEGAIVMLTDEDEEDQAAMVVEVRNTEVLVDLNHPLAGEDLWYSVEVLKLT